MSGASRAHACRAGASALAMPADLAEASAIAVKRTRAKFGLAVFRSLTSSRSRAPSALPRSAPRRGGGGGDRKQRRSDAHALAVRAHRQASSRRGGVARRRSRTSLSSAAARRRHASWLGVRAAGGRASPAAPSPTGARDRRVLARRPRHRCARARARRRRRVFSLQLVERARLALTALGDARRRLAAFSTPSAMRWRCRWRRSSWALRRRDRRAPRPTPTFWARWSRTAAAWTGRRRRRRRRRDAAGEGRALRRWWRARTGRRTRKQEI